jgi:hypothetical protein
MSSSEGGDLVSRVAALEARVAELSDRHQIHEMYLRYLRGYPREPDFADADYLRSAFWPDAVIEYPGSTETVEDLATGDSHYTTLSSFGHILADETVDIDGDEARVTCVVACFGTLREGRSRIVVGRYHDRLERRDGDWRVAHRVFVSDFFTETDVAIDWS